MESIISAVIAGGLALVGVIITNISSNKSIESKLITAQAVTDTKLDNLTTEMKKYGTQVEKIPVMESDIHKLKEDVKELKAV